MIKSVNIIKLITATKVNMFRYNDFMNLEDINIINKEGINIERKRENTSICFVTLPFSSLTTMEDNMKNRAKLNGDLSQMRPIKSISMGILYLSSYIKKECGSSLNQYMCDMSLEADRLYEYNSIDDFILETIKKSVPKPPDIIAISLMFMFNYKFFKKIVKMYKLLWPSTTIIVGGIHAKYN